MRSEHFNYKVVEQVYETLDLDPGVYVTNCTICNRTCHRRCAYAKNEDKYKCVAMDTNVGSDNATCRICPKKCHWSSHINTSHAFELKTQTVVKTDKCLETAYYTAKGEKSKYEAMLANVESKKKNAEKEARKLVKQIRQCIQRLHEIALRPCTLTDLEYIEILIQGERQEKKDRWEERVKSYESLKQQEKMVQDIIQDKESFLNE